MINNLQFLLTRIKNDFSIDSIFPFVIFYFEQHFHLIPLNSSKSIELCEPHFPMMVNSRFFFFQTSDETS